ncbi:lactonase family protein [Bosea caraganae]|uniref:Lactonase family protein n=1 Tax=Bosea caraganae TaxID=2763117 RepID=A0A370LAC0_9HYPH|nr:lactonase family protein [Bosea caraganae]RDJ21849.1 lactonase family protein [Bosea caraganae]RDJ28120.1 lactonase family protein [Bosea caraganae]
MSSHSPSSQADLAVYIGNGAGGDISVLRLSAADGKLSPVQRLPFPGLVEPGRSLPLALSPGRDVLYAAMRGAPRGIASFRIDRATGVLSVLGFAAMAESVAYIATDRSGRFLFGASYDGNVVTMSPIGADGVAQEVAQRLPTLPHAHGIMADPANRHVLATSLGGDVVYSFALDRDGGMLSQPRTASVPAGTGPRHFVFAPSGKRLYLLGELDASVTVFDYDAERGVLAGRQVVTTLPPGFGGKPWGADIQITPDGRFLYASERTGSTLASFAVEADGRLRPLQHIATETQPRGFGIDPRGRYLLALGQSTDHVTVYAIDGETGGLGVTDRVEVGSSPDWVEMVELAG